MFVWFFGFVSMSCVSERACALFSKGLVDRAIEVNVPCELSSGFLVFFVFCFALCDQRNVVCIVGL